MTRLPLAPVYDDEPRIAATWQRIADARDRRARRRRTARVVVPPLLALGAVATAIAIAVHPAARPGALASTDPATRLDAGAEIAAAETAHSSVALDDGSRLVLDPGARMQVLSNDGARFSTLLERGTIAYSVHPGGPRRWEIETALATIEVVGTRFVVAQDAHQVTVVVQRGVVMVRGERVAGRVQRLTAGQRLVIRADAAITAVAAPAEDPESPTAPGSHDGAADDSGSAAAASSQVPSAGDPPSIAPTDGVARGSSSAPAVAATGGVARGSSSAPAVAATDGVARGPSSAAPDGEARGRARTGSAADRTWGHGSMGPTGDGASGDSPRRSADRNVTRDGVAQSPAVTAQPGGTTRAAGPSALGASAAGAPARPRGNGRGDDPRAVARAALAATLERADRLRPVDPQAAAELLERALANQPDDSAAGLAAFALGRLYLDSLGQPGRAAEVFRRIVNRGNPRALLEDAYARLVEALLASGDRDGARDALREYEHAYPDSRRAPALRDRLSVP